MSEVSRGGNSYNKLWDIKKESREIFILYNFLELEKFSFFDIFLSKHESIFSTGKIGIPSTDVMITALENSCLDFASHIEKTNNRFIRNKFTYKGIRFHFNYEDYLLSRSTFDKHCAKLYLLHIYNHISLSNEIFSSLTINNTRMVNFVWSYLRISRYSRDNTCLSINHIDNPDKKTLNNIFPFIYDDFSLVQSPSGAEEKTEQVKMFFGLLSLDKYKKETEIKFIYDQWDSVKNDNRIIYWLKNIESRTEKSNNEGKNEIINWIWKSIKTKYYKGITPPWGNIENDSAMDNIQQKKENIITFFDLMTNDAIKNSIISELKTSASKAKYKILNNEKTHLNTPISEKTKSKFDALKKHFNLSNEELIKSLIDDGYEKLKKYGINPDN